MSAWVCRKCTAAYSVGAPKCPECGASSRIAEAEQNEIEEAAAMAKSTVHGGPTVDDAEGGEQSSPTPEEGGTTSSTSSKKDETSPETSESADPSPARKTGSRSAKGRTGSSSARGTAGDQTAPSSDSDED